MKLIATIEEAEEYIKSYDFFGNLNENKESLNSTLKQCETLAIQFNREQLLCRTRTFILYLLIEENNLIDATKLAESNLQLAKEKHLDAELLYMISIIAHLYQLTGNLSASEELIQIALDQIPIIKDDIKICKIYLMVAKQYNYTKNKNKCIETIKKCITYAHKTNDNSLIAICYDSYAANLIDFKLFEETELVLQTGKEFAQKSGNKLIIAFINEKFGCFYNYTKEYKKAIKYLNSALKHYTYCQNTDKEMSISIDLIKVYFNTNEYKKAYKILTDTESKALTSNANKILLDTYALHVQYYEAKKKYKEALDYMKKYQATNELIYSEAESDKIRNLQIQHEVKTIQTERDNAEKMARIKHDFLANMSHEIRTPINSILGIAYLLQQDSLNEKQQDYINRLNHSGEYLLGIINDVLDISKIETGKFNLASAVFSLQKVAENIHQSLSVKSSSKNIDFNLILDESLPGYCIGDATRVHQILTNLVFNAIKFTEQGYVRLIIKPLSIENTTALISFSVEDTGIGINEQQLQRIFIDYEQAEHTTQIKFGGTGLGLSISKKLTELMNGTIQVESTIKKGSTFTVQIPFLLPDKTIPITETDNIDTNIFNNKTVYIADDIEENRKIITELLLDINNTLNVKTASNGKELLNLVDQQLPDIILMDLDMPELNGFETASIIQKEYQKNKTKIIACTASLLTIPKEELLAFGFDDLLLKPFTIHQLTKTIY